MHAEVLGNRQEGVTDALQQRLVDGGDQLLRQLLVFLDRFAGTLLILFQVAYLVEDPFQLALVVAQGVLGFLHRDIAAADQGFGVGLAHTALGVDHLVHLRVGHRGVVALVVAAPAVADQVDDDVFVEFLAEVHGQT